MKYENEKCYPHFYPPSWILSFSYYKSFLPSKEGKYEKERHSSKKLISRWSKRENWCHYMCLYKISEDSQWRSWSIPQVGKRICVSICPNLEPASLYTVTASEMVALKSVSRSMRADGSILREKHRQYVSSLFLSVSLNFMSISRHPQGELKVMYVNMLSHPSIQSHTRLFHRGSQISYPETAIFVLKDFKNSVTCQDCTIIVEKL